VWAAVAERLNPAKAKPQLRPRIEAAELTSARDVDYVMLRSPDRTQACYLRLTPQEWALAELMDGTRTVARLVAEFARIGGKLAPDQVTRVVADLAGNRMLEELPVDAFKPLERVRRRPWPLRLGAAILAVIRGRRIVVANVDPLVGFLYRAGGRLLFTRPVAVLCGLVAVAGLAAFCWTWARGEQSVFLSSDSYALGAALLLGLNVFALACHELGHALAAKHAGRRVPMAGFLIYFGIPSVFVDTTDVWMAGRGARIRTTAAGPAAGLVLAGSAQLIALAYPPVAPFAFKLAFAWYINALFNLNPFMALDGYYLLMDAIEVPNLRARGLAWVSARLRRKPPRFKQLDGEGRLIAIYGMLAMVWLVIAANIAYRVYVDRVAGLALGLWRSGWVERTLFLAVVAGLCAPLVYVVASWLRTRWRRWSERRVERHRVADEPRRLQVLRDSPLGGLGPDELNDLAAASRWVHPRPGELLVVAGGAQRSVYIVVEGALEGRRPGDPGGMVRERVNAGGMVGLAAALTAGPATLSWHTAGTTLLAVPSSAVVRAVGPLPGPPPADQEEIDQLLDQVPAFATLSESERLGLSVYARPMHVPAGTPIELARPSDALVVASGVLRNGSGYELRRGSVVGPFGNDWPVQAGVALTPTRAWWLPTMVRSAVPPPPVPGPVSGGDAGPRRAPLFGAHPRADYPPLAAPPGLPPSHVDDRTEQRFERWLWLLLLLLALLALTLTTSNFFPGQAWAEMPSDRALFTVTQGSATATFGRTARRVDAGESSYLTGAGGVDVPADSTARLTFHGGGVALICGGSHVQLGPLSTDQTARPGRPSGELVLISGRVVVDTTGTSAAFTPLTLTVRSQDPFTGQHLTKNNGIARYAVTAGSSTASHGTVVRDGTFLTPTGAALGCGPTPDATTPPPPTGGPAPTDTAVPSPSATPSASASVTPSPTPSPSATAPTTSASTTTRKPPTTTKKTTTGPPPPNPFPPSINALANFPTIWAPLNSPCGLQSVQFRVTVVDDGRTATVFETPSDMHVWFTWSISGGDSGTSAQVAANGVTSNSIFLFDIDMGPFPSAGTVDTTITFTFFASDPQTTVSATPLTVEFRNACGVIVK
jgi:putative peptide zinc metalloprotease protein